MIRVGVVGGSGYIGGELLRLLLGHPEIELVTTTSTRLAGRRVDGAHPNLRGRTDLTFTHPDQLGRYDVLLLASPHRETMTRIHDYLDRAAVLVDLSGDFRLRDPEVYARHYGTEHTEPALLGGFVTGLPELHRKELREADRISVPGCMATAGILALHPVAQARLTEGPVTLDARTGSSGSGVAAGPANLHAERSGAMRVFAPTTHRHSAEVTQATGLPVKMTATGVEAVRACRCWPGSPWPTGWTRRRCGRPSGPATPGNRSCGSSPSGVAPTGCRNRSCSAAATSAMSVLPPTAATRSSSGRWTTWSRAAPAAPCSA